MNQARNINMQLTQQSPLYTHVKVKVAHNLFLSTPFGVPCNLSRERKLHGIMVTFYVNLKSFIVFLSVGIFKTKPQTPFSILGLATPTQFIPSLFPNLYAVNSFLKEYGHTIYLTYSLRDFFFFFFLLHKAYLMGKVKVPPANKAPIEEGKGLLGEVEIEPQTPPHLYLFLIPFLTMFNCHMNGAFCGHG